MGLIWAAMIVLKAVPKTVSLAPAPPPALNVSQAILFLQTKGSLFALLVSALAVHALRVSQLNVWIVELDFILRDLAAVLALIIVLSVQLLVAQLALRAFSWQVNVHALQTVFYHVQHVQILIPHLVQLVLLDIHSTMLLKNVLKIYHVMVLVWPVPWATVWKKASV